LFFYFKFDLLIKKNTDSANNIILICGMYVKIDRFRRKIFKHHPSYSPSKAYLPKRHKPMTDDAVMILINSFVEVCFIFLFYFKINF